MYCICISKVFVFAFSHFFLIILAEVDLFMKLFKKPAFALGEPWIPFFAPCSKLCFPGFVCVCVSFMHQALVQSP